MTLHNILLIVQHAISLCGILIILSGVLAALWRYLCYLFTTSTVERGQKINAIRLDLGRILILGLEFIVAADLINTTTTPDYYAVGILAIIVAIRTLLSFSLNKEIADLSKNQ